MSLKAYDIWNLIDREVMTAMVKRRNIFQLAEHLCVSPDEIDEKYLAEFGLTFDGFKASLPSLKYTDEERGLLDFIKRLPTTSLHPKAREEMSKHDIIMMYQGGATTRDVAAAYGMKHHSLRKAVMDLYGATTEELQEQAKTLYQHEISEKRLEGKMYPLRIAVTFHNHVRKRARSLR